MQTKLSVAAAGLAEAGWLAALVVVPVFFNAQSSRIFEGEKIALFRSLALAIAMALVIRWLEEGRAAWAVAGRTFWRQPLLQAALALTAAYVVSTVFSIAPYFSLWGSYERAQGLYTWLSYLTVFVAIALLVRTRTQLERLVTVIVLASVAPALYAIVQHSGGDPIRWGLDVTERAHSTTGNPIFLGAYLIMVVPITLVRTIVRLNTQSRRAHVAAGVYLVVLTLQLLALIYSQSRGPLIGFAVSLAVLFLVMALQQQRRLTVAVLGLAGAAALFIGVLNMKGGPLAPLRNVASVNLLGRLFEAGSGTGKVRVVIWEGAVHLLAADPWRDLIGYGPETLYLAYTPFYPPELARYESRRVAPDRAHNETFDALVTTGIIGCAAELVLFVALFSSLLRWLGVVSTASQQRWFRGLAIVGAGVGMLAPYLVEGRFRFSGLGLPLGVVAGLVLYLLAVGVSHRRPAADLSSWRNLLLLALLVGLLAHFIEIQFGIAISSTRLLFWVYAALSLVVGTGLLRGDADPSVADDTLLESSGFDAGFTVGLVLIVLTFDFFRPELELRRNASALLAVFLGTWLVGAAVATAEAIDRPLRQLARYGASSLLAWMVFCAGYVPWLKWRPSLESFEIGLVLPAVTHLVNCVSILYMFVFATTLCSAAALVRGARFSRPLTAYGRKWHVAASVLLLSASVPIIILTNLDVSRADMFLKQVELYIGRQRFDAAVVLAEEAHRLHPWLDQQSTVLVQALLEAARARPEEAEIYLSRAEAALEQAQRHNPRNLDNVRNSARLHHSWAGLVTDRTLQTHHLDTAQDFYDQAVHLSPNNASLWNEWALLYIDMHQADKALPLLNHSLEIDDSYATTWWLRANVRLQTGSPELSLADYDHALSINPKLLAAWSGKGLALAQLDRLTDAIAANQEALKIAPGDLISHRNLALLYSQTGRPGLAVQEAKAALAVATSPKDKSDLEEFIRRIEGEEGQRSG